MAVRATEARARTSNGRHGPLSLRGPAWEAADGSKLTGKRVAVAPAAPGSMPLQLVKAEAATGSGAMTGITYIQRVNTKGGVAPAEPCGASMAGSKKQVAYRADYLSFKM